MIECNNAIFLIIDIQEKLVKAVNNKNNITEKAEKFAKLANILSIPMIITEQYPKGLGQTISSITNYENNKRLEKYSFNACDEQEFRQALENFNRKTIILSGIETHICVLQTAIALQKEGYEVYVLSDVTASRTDFEHQSGLETMKQFGIKIITFETILFGLLKTSKHPEFKELQKMIL